MKYTIGMLALLITFAGCGSDPEPPAETAPAPTAPAATDAMPAPAPAEAAPEGEVQLRGTGQTFRFFESDTERSTGQKPSFEISSPSFIMQDDVVILEDATATVYTEEESAATFRAAEARLDQENEIANLTGSVEIQMNDQHMTMEAMEWRNADRKAVSDGAITFKQGDTTLEAAGMEYERDSETLILNGVTGSVRIKNNDQARVQAQPTSGFARIMGALLGLFSFIGTAHAQTQASNFSFLDIVEPAAHVVFKAGKLQSIDGDGKAIHIRLRAETEEVQPMELKAVNFGMSWPESGDNTQPTAIALEDNVEVDSAQGLIRSNRARLDFAANSLTFTENVSGSTPEIREFQADKIVYDLENGDADMINLRATGVPMASGGGYSSMNINRAGSVRFTDGSAKQMTGGVNITLAGDTGALELGASTVAFTWAGGADGASPVGVKLNGNVSVKSADGTIKSGKADMDMKAKSIVFTENVSGTSPQIKAFTCDKLVYGLESGDTRMTNLVAKGLPMETTGDEKKNAYKSMDVNKAPDVLLKNGQLDALRGGVEVSMESAAEGEPPLQLTGDEISFVFGEDGASPQRAILNGNAKVDTGTMWIKSDKADFNLGQSKVAFSGEVTGSFENVKNLASKLIVYDLQRKSFYLEGGAVDELRTGGPAGGGLSLPGPGGAASEAGENS